MDFLFWIFFAFFIIYFFSLILYRVGLTKPVSPQSTEKPYVSIVIAARNEAKRIPQLIESLKVQDYPREKFEVIIVDDDSSDGTYALLQKMASDFPHLKVLSTRGLSSPYHYKKSAMSLGIEKAQGEIILTTDADCLMGPNWVSTILGYFRKEIGMVVGFSGIKYGRKMFSKLQALDYLQLMAGSQGTANLGIIWACSGQNLAFRKSIFQKVGGYRQLMDRVGGDDSLFMQVVRKKTGTGVVFASDTRSWVETEPLRNLSTFLRQHIRWASEANYMYKLNPTLFFVIISTFIANLSLVFYAVLALAGCAIIKPFIFFVLLKLAGEGIVALKATAVYKRKDLLKVFFPWFVLQIPYIVFMGIFSFWGNRMSWNRR